MADLLAANEAAVRNLTESAVASSRIEGEHPDPLSIGVVSLVSLGIPFNASVANPASLSSRPTWPPTTGNL